jgi:hypothetical protein
VPSCPQTESNGNGEIEQAAERCRAWMRIAQWSRRFVHFSNSHKTYIPLARHFQYGLRLSYFPALRAVNMTSRDLNDKQLEAIERRIVPMLRYLNRLAERASAKLPPHDPLCKQIMAVHNAVYGLRIGLNYLHSRCRDVTGQDRFGLPIPPPKDGDLQQLDSSSSVVRKR